MREAGVLIAVSSLPSRHGIGDFGLEAREFLKMSKRAGFKYWQILPLNPVGFGNSPYQPYGSKPFDEIYISLDLLQKDKLITKVPNFHENAEKVDYEKVRNFKLKYLKLAFENYKSTKKTGFARFKNANKWVYNYAVFVTFKKNNYLNQWHYWPAEFKNWIHDKKMDLTPYLSQIEFEMWLQFIAYKQWQDLHKYANARGIEVVGDMPIYVGIDSVDVWENTEAFLLDDQYFPTHIAGVPPDFFSATGQRWGNPLYDWDYLAAHNFDFWKERLGYNAKLFDMIRIDHFRAFDTYWKIPSSCPTAVEGEWVEAPGYQLFDALLKDFPNLKIIAEDLGDLRPEVLVLRDHFDLPGMEIVAFTYNPISMQPLTNPRRIIYTGTHDNQTMVSWFNSQDLAFKRASEDDLNRRGFIEYDNIFDKFLAYTFFSSANIAIVPMQDLILLDDSARLNTPGTIGSPNWEWKLKDLTKYHRRLKFLLRLVKVSKRK
ncbi:MAG TPA: 4-alpha-glucanotransferase [Bacilli bacterium]|nr:4-alpha-glucanotransferase [Bacilli bacterium]